MAEIFINGPAGRLEGRLELAENPKAPIALVLQPNPMTENMNNRITYTLYQSFLNLGFSVLRFNFRGVGKSQGEIDGSGASELLDTITVLDWMTTLPVETGVTWIAGYDFGAWIGAQVLMRRPEIKGFVFASLPLHQHSFDFLSPCPASGLLIHPENDLYNTEESVVMLAEQLDDYTHVNVDYSIIPGADYLYTRRLKQLYDTVLEKVPELRSKKPKKSYKRIKKQEVFNEDY